MKIFLTTIFLGMIASGCCTLSVNEQVRECSAPVNEFVPKFDYEAKIYTGLYLGVEEKNSILFHQYVFNNILTNKPNRVLQILIPLDKEDLAEINEIESEEKSDISETAYLFSQFYGFTSEYSLKEGIIKTQNYFKKYYPEIKNKYSPHMINLWIRPEKERSFVNLIKKDEGASGQYWSSFDSTNNLKWYSRNKTKIGFQRLKYIYSIPVDIITSPFQLIAYLVVVNGNSCL